MRIRKAGRTMALTALLVVGCGGDDGLGKAALVKEANAICKEYAEKGRELGRPDFTNPTEAKAYFTEAHDLAEQQRKKLDDLEPAKDVEADYEELVTSFGEATEFLDRLTDASETERIELIQDLTPISERVDEAANAVGATDCASA